ncbi:DUF1775 domain-containing protein [Xanthobacter sp. KR7-65]|uniref:DUF1775 domain-containing protein n=1 Tax=Xanthobacter sp. KR7-65 TaxID=3156612 RepID=UPI0032B60C4C
MTRTAIFGALAAAVAAGLAAAPASAHVTLEKSDAVAGTYYKAVLKVGHGCEGSPTTSLKVTIPDGLVAAKPMPKPGWTLAAEAGAYDRAYAFHGKEVREGVKSIRWSGGSLPDGQYDEFVFIAYLAPEAGARAVPVPVVQTCEKGELRWVEVARPGEKAAQPAPVLKIAAPGGTPAVARVAQADALVIDAPWSRATPGGAKVAGGFLRITNTGTTPDRLVGGTFARSSEVQVHEMGMSNGVMTMRQLTGGLEIPPGQTVELAPGGYHLMFTGLTTPLKEGETVSGTLTFEKAGKVDVSYEVRSIGAKAGDAAAAAGGHQHH